MKFKRFLSFLICLSLISGCIELYGASAQDTVTTIIACSDFQNPSGNAAGKAEVNNILSAMKADGLTSAEGFFCCGDYDYEYTDTKGGTDALKEATADIVYGESVFVQGNHDSAIGTNGLSTSGDRDPQSGNYGVFVINEDDYMWNNSDEARIKQTSQNLIEYLNVKLEEGFKKPIFVISHLPLHYSMRTKNDGDGMHANYIFDVLNTAGSKGLNIIFLYGHDHSNGWDDYLGGSSVYLEKGDSILIAQNSRTVFEEKTLNFTYVNPGYTGYYDNNNGADDTLTMTRWLISGSSVTVKRYSKDGIHNMKNAGVRNSYKNETAYSPNTDVYASPQTIELTEVTDKTPIDDIIKKSGFKYKKITDTSELRNGGKYLLIYNDSTDYIMTLDSVSKSNSSGTRTGFDIVSSSEFGTDNVINLLSEYHWTFKKESDGWLIGNGKENITFTATSSESATASLSENGDIITIGGAADAFTFTADKYCLNYNSRKVINGYHKSPAAFYIYEFTGELVIPDTEKTSGYRYDRITDISELCDGGKYLLIYDDSSDYVMTLDSVSKSNGSGTRTGFDIVSCSSFGANIRLDLLSEYHWTFKKEADGWLIGNGKENITFTATSSESATASLTQNGDVLTVEQEEGLFTFSSDTYSLNYNSRKVINGYNTNPAHFYVYRYTGEVYVNSFLSTPAISMTLKNDFSFNYKLNEIYEGLDPQVFINGKELSYTVSGENLVFSYGSVLPHTLTESIEAELVLDGVSVQKDTLSPAEYCYELLEVYPEDEKLCTLITDILNYGAQAQLYKSHGVDNLANKYLSDSQKTVRECAAPKNSIAFTDAVEESALWKSHALCLDSGISIKLGFIANDYSDIYVSVRSPVGDEITRINNFYVSPYGKRYFYFDGVYANGMDDIYTFTVMKGEKAISETLSYSAGSYIALAKGDVLPITKALLAYAESAKAYSA
ncbi:MAG: hypothetical protein IJ408_02515 [Clostridia bacterium]|nr:hypothetical protein [Clostridia bacterium]